MKNLKYFLFLLIGAMATNCIQAQSFLDKVGNEIDTIVVNRTHKRANYHFNGLSYPKAIEKYSKMIEKGFSPDSVRRKLAISYFKIKETEKSEELFAELVSSGEHTPMDIYYYSQSLKYNEKYDEADKWIAKYKEVKGEDTRGELQHEAAPVIKEIYSKERYKIEPVWFNSVYSEFGAVQLDEQIIFASGRKEDAIIQYEYSWKGDPYLDLYRTIENAPALYKEPRLISKGINSRFHDGPIAFSSSVQEVFITRSNFHIGMPKYSSKKENHFKIYSARLEDGKWVDLTELSFNNDDYSCGHPSISSDNSTLYFASDMPGGYGESDIYSVTRIDSGWSEPKNLGADINTEGDEMFPFVSGKGELYFSSNGQLGLGGLDIFMATANGNNSFEIINMGYPLNGSSDDFSFYLKKDGTDGYFASNREGGKGDDDIYKFTMLDKPRALLNLRGITRSEKTGEIVPNAGVVVLDEQKNEVFRGESNGEGKFETKVNPGKTYELIAMKEKYTKAITNLTADSDKANANSLEVDIMLPELSEWGVFGFIFEKESGTGVNNVEIVITDKANGKELIDNTDGEGKFRRLLQPDTDYDILLRKTKYFTRRGEFTTRNMEPGWIDVKEFIEVEMEEIVVDKTIEIPNIYYDLAKWNIREDAAVELDKVVQFLLDNPTITIELGSHTDARGSKSSNQGLSQKRAESAVVYIVKNEINNSRITAKGYGESKIKNKCADGIKCSEEEHQENRRTEIRIVDF